MSKSRSIRQWKNQIMGELSQDDEIIKALDLNEKESEDDLIWNRLFPHYYIPDVQETVKSYILMEIDIPERRANRYAQSSGVFVYPTIIFYVLVHQDDMHMDLVGESGTRMDYLAELIEEKYEGRQGFGVGTLTLKSDVAGSLNTPYRYRQLIFEAVDTDEGLCAF